MNTRLAMKRIRVFALLVVLACVSLFAAACNQSNSVPGDADVPAEDSAAAVLQAYRQFGGEIQELNAANATITAEVKDLQGTVPAYDLTGGNPPCAGFVRPVPSLVFNLGEGATSVQFEFTGNALSTLIVVQQDETITCDPSAPPAVKSSLSLDKPAAGKYGVWVGRAATTVPLDGTLTATWAE